MEILQQIIKRYGLFGIIMIVTIAGASWYIAHAATQPGEKVTIFWGMIEYVKIASKDNERINASESDISRNTIVTKDEKTTSASPTVKNNVPIGTKKTEIDNSKSKGWVYLGTRTLFGWSSKNFKGDFVEGGTITFTNSRPLMDQSPRFVSFNNYDFGNKLSEYVSGEKAKILATTSVGLGRKWAEVVPIAE